MRKDALTWPRFQPLSPERLAGWEGTGAFAGRQGRGLPGTRLGPAPQSTALPWESQWKRLTSQACSSPGK